ncbi:PREDICTED: mucin-5AC isoform X2 [Nelumbo nucifera]|uniref:Mucin-5AC isoform X2 n=1 Tax=Nelumbo nucifera TaxID=4432 RepID=A0A1U7ZBD8_NELNU|nr:PREDICTED: mucin-5AC isoform X2 [Nelumbo nucifera]
MESTIYSLQWMGESMIMTDTSESPPTLLAPRSSSLVRSVSTTKTSRLSMTHSENNYSSRPTRSGSVTRPSISTMHYTTYSSSSNRSSSILNTSSASVTSSSRPSTPTTRSTTRPSTPSARPLSSRPSTPTRSHPGPNISSVDKPRVSQNSRPSTSSSRPQVSANLSSASRPNSRPSTPTRRTQTAAPGPAPVVARSASVGRVLPNGRSTAPASRGSSPGPRARPSPQPIDLPDFPHDTPPNLRTTLPDRPISAGRSRPSVAVTVRGNLETSGPVNPPRRQSSPIVSRGRLAELSGRGRLHTNGHDVEAPELQKTPPVLEPTVRRLTKPTTTSESTGFGRTISKKSLDMALRHMDIRNGTGSVRSLSGTTLFPQSIRSNLKSQPIRVLDASSFLSSNGAPPASSNGGISENGNCIDKSLHNEAEEGDGRLSAKLSQMDIYESSRYDAILLKEDLKNTNWLHNVDDKSDKGITFDHRFEPLPEPFGLL